MTTLLLQHLGVLLFLVFAGLALAIGRITLQAPPFHRAAWQLVGAAFGLLALNMTVHGAFGTLAYVRGAQSRTLADYLVWNAVFNHSRTVAALGFCVALTGLMLARGQRPGARFPLAAGIAVGGGMLVGALIGWREPSFTALRHYSAIAQGDVILLLLLLGVLFAGVLSSRVDRLLWFVLSIYAFSVALNVLWFAAFSRVDTPGQWAPRPWVIQLYRVVLTSVMVLLAAYRLRLALRGRAVRGLGERPEARMRLVG